MHIDQRKQQFSDAYVSAVAAAAGFTTSKPDVDDDSVDLKISANKRFHASRAELNLQLKCTAGIDRGKGTFPFELMVKNYEELRGTDVLVPRLLVVVCVPENVNEWLTQEEDGLTMYHCGYWHSLRAADPSSNLKSVTVQINTKNTLTVTELTRLMGNIAKREYP